MRRAGHVALWETGEVRTGFCGETWGARDQMEGPRRRCEESTDVASKSLMGKNRLKWSLRIAADDSRL
jgi:hypothetical protein